MAILGYTYYNRLYGTTIQSGAASDTILGLGGNDTIYAGGGDDSIFGGTGNDTIFAASPTSFGTAAWGHDVVRGGAGNDYINYYNTTSSVTIWGDDEAPGNDDGSDFIAGGFGADWIAGGGGADTINGGAGNDIIYGDNPAGGLVGADTIIGGGGMDQMWGGGSDDTFVFLYPADSSATYATADVIHDFDAIHDNIDMWNSGTSANYAERTFTSVGTLSGDFNKALGIANTLLTTKDFVFLTNGKQGYLFGDLNHNMTADIAVELKGLTSLTQFNYSDIV